MAVMGGPVGIHTTETQGAGYAGMTMSSMTLRDVVFHFPVSGKFP